MTDWISHPISAVIGAVVGAVVGRSVNRPDAKIDDLKREVVQLRDERMVRVEGRLDKVEENGCSVGKQVLAKLEHLTGMINKLDLKMDRIAETTATQAAEIRSNRSFIDNIDKSFQRHKETPHHG